MHIKGVVEMCKAVSRATKYTRKGNFTTEYNIRSDNKPKLILHVHIGQNNQLGRKNKISTLPISKL